MNANVKFSRSLWIGISLVLALLFCIQGCKKEEPTTKQTMTPSADSTSAEPTQGQMAAADEMAQTAEAKVAAGEQTTCPVMGNPIDKDIFVEYQGKKVYFCCQACVAKFNADPAKYIAKLPQFQK